MVGGIAVTFPATPEDAGDDLQARSVVVGEVDLAQALAALIQFNEDCNLRCAHCFASATRTSCRPSLDRAQRQLRWLAARDDDVRVLTETKASAGSQHLVDAFKAAGYAVRFPEHAPGDLGVMIVSKLACTPDPLGAAMAYLPARVAAIVVGTSEGPLRIAGAYVPSRDTSVDKTERKKTWIQQFPSSARSDRKRRSVPAPGRWAHLGYRYDHAHGSSTLVRRLSSCEYIHEARATQPDGTRLTDHSGLAVRLAMTATTPLLTSDPITAAADPEPDLTLF